MGDKTVMKVDNIEFHFIYDVVAKSICIILYIKQFLMKIRQLNLKTCIFFQKGKNLLGIIIFFSIF